VKGKLHLLELTDRGAHRDAESRKVPGGCWTGRFRRHSDSGRWGGKM